LTGEGERIHPGDDHFLLERHAQDSLVGIDSYLALPIRRKAGPDLQSINAGTVQRGEEPRLFGMEELLGGPDGDRGERTLRKILRQFLGDQGNQIGYFALAGKIFLQNFQFFR
jgi:hypothetical protein